LFNLLIIYWLNTVGHWIPFLMTSSLHGLTSTLAMRIKGKLQSMKGINLDNDTSINFLFWLKNIRKINLYSCVAYCLQWVNVTQGYQSKKPHHLRCLVQFNYLIVLGTTLITDLYFKLFNKLCYLWELSHPFKPTLVAMSK